MTPDHQTGRELVVIVHGLWMHGAVYALLAARLRACGYQCALFSYRSITLPLEEIARRLARFARAREPSRVHFVGHSLGGLVVLDTLARDRTLPVGRVLLLGTPAAGSKAVEQLARSRAGRALIGRALPQWRPQQAREVTARVPVGAIAGTQRMGVASLVVRLAPPNDGAVTVEETRLPGLADHIVMRTSHSGMAVSPQVSRQICHFLKNGRFARA
jgi:pimeloyl-ACP methyl ester carboxylesterase